MTRLIALASGVASGVVVTRRLHERPPTDFWARPVGSLTWRRADLPLRGVAAIAVAGLLLSVHGRQLRRVGWGAIVGCLTVAAIDPYRG
jgi:hypothetical protein